jgi:hypothetical protein
MKAIIVIVLTVSFMLVTNKLTNIHNFKIAKSWEDVKAHQYEQTPGLLRAEKIGLAKEFDVSVPIPGTNMTFEIDEIWYNNQDVYVFFNIDKSFKDIPNIHFTFFSEEVETTYRNGPYTKNVGAQDGIFYKNRYYNRLVVTPIYDDKQELVSEVKSVVIDDLYIQINNKRYSLDPIALKLDYKQENEKRILIDVHEEYFSQLGTIVWKDLMIGTSNNLLNFSFIPKEGYALNTIRATITSNHGEERNIVFIDKLGNNEYAVNFEPFNQYPSEISVQLENITLVDDRSFSFSFNVDDYTTSRTEKKLDDRIKTVQNTDIYLNRLFYDDRGMMFEILLKPKESKKGEFHLVAVTPNTIHADQKGIDKDVLQSLPYIVKATNEKGKIAEYGSRGSGPGERMSMFLERSFIEKSEQVQVEFSQLLNELKVEKEFVFKTEQ